MLVLFGVPLYQSPAAPSAMGLENPGNASVGFKGTFQGVFSVLLSKIIRVPPLEAPSALLSSGNKRSEFGGSGCKIYQNCCSCCTSPISPGEGEGGADRSHVATCREVAVC